MFSNGAVNIQQLCNSQLSIKFFCQSNPSPLLNQVACQSKSIVHYPSPKWNPNLVVFDPLLHKHCKISCCVTNVFICQSIPHYYLPNVIFRPKYHSRPAIKFETDDQNKDSSKTKQKFNIVDSFTSDFKWVEIKVVSLH